MTETAGFDERLRAVQQALRAANHDLVWELSAGASDSAIRACEAAIGRTLPDEFRAFLRMHDGASMGVDHEAGYSYDVTIFGINDIVEEHRRFEALYRDVNRDGKSMRHARTLGATDHFWDGLIAFVHYGDGECVFDMDPGTEEPGVVRDLDLEALQDTRERIIATSFEDWFSRILESAINRRRLVYWIRP